MERRPGDPQAGASLSRVALTFDDGPHPEWTPAVLDALTEERIGATFFIQGDRLAERPDLARSAVARGHSVQAHCHRHESHHRRSRAEIDDDITRLVLAMDESRLPRPRLWRPPYGDIASPRTGQVAAAHGLRLVTWTVETCDWARSSAEDILAELLAQERPASRLEPDSVVLMHDSVGAHTADLVHLLAREIRGRGWRFGLVSARAVTPQRPFSACR